MFDFIVIGAGFAGSVIAERIASQLNKKVLVIEKKNHIAGHCYDYKNEENIIIHKYGPHLFHTNNKAVFTYLSQFTEWLPYQHKVIGYIDGKKVPLPFNLNTLHELFPATLANQIEQKLLQRYPLNTKVPILELQKESDPDLQFLASFIYERVFLQYTAKQWGKKPEEISSEVTARVPVFIGKDNRYFTDTYQAVPKQGYTKLFENMLNHPNIKIMLQTDCKEVIDIVNDDIMVFGKKFGGKVVFTGQVDYLFDYRFGQLPYRSTDMQFETLDIPQFQETATVNYPNNYDFTRITEFKHIHPVNTNKTTILKEYPQEHKEGITTPYYPVFTDDSKKMYDQYAEYAKRYNNLILLGRLAEYKYYDMDDIVERALEVFEKEIE